jgi:polyhydroxyalkanoate synthesis repressor PhaR
MSLRKADPDSGTVAKAAVVKKYANRRLYNTATSSYVTLDELSQMVRKGEDFVVFDAKTGEDITRSVLTQIILEEDSKGRNLLPIGFLRQVISFYDDSLQSFLPRYLDLSMENFARHQDQMRSYMEQTFGRFFPLTQFEDMARQNMALFQRAASMFRPFQAGEEGEGTPLDPAAAAAGQPAQPPEKTSALDSEMRELKNRMESLQRQLDSLQRNQKPAAE